MKFIKRGWGVRIFGALKMLEASKNKIMTLFSAKEDKNLRINSVKNSGKKKRNIFNAYFIRNVLKDIFKPTYTGIFSKNHSLLTKIQR